MANDVFRDCFVRLWRPRNDEQSAVSSSLRDPTFMSDRSNLIELPLFDDR